MDLKKKAESFSNGMILPMVFSQELELFVGKSKTRRTEAFKIMKDAGISKPVGSFLFGLQRLHPEIQKVMCGGKSSLDIVSITFAVGYNLSLVPLGKQIGFWEQIKVERSEAKQLEKLDILRGKQERSGKQQGKAPAVFLEESKIDPIEIARQFEVMFEAHRFISLLHTADFRNAQTAFGDEKVRGWLNGINAMDENFQRLVKPRIFNARHQLKRSVQTVQSQNAPAIEPKTPE